MSVRRAELGLAFWDYLIARRDQRRRHRMSEDDIDTFAADNLRPDKRLAREQAEAAKKPPLSKAMVDAWYEQVSKDDRPKQRIAVNQREVVIVARSAYIVSVCGLCMALIWPGGQAARRHVEEFHGGELVT